IRQVFPATGLGPYFLWQEATLRRSLGQRNQARELAQALTGTTLGDQGWYLLGSLYEVEDGNPARAREAYFHILNEFPRSLLYEPVRVHIRSLTTSSERSS
ncbi:MAG: hypothetical protein D6762_02810, partial [Candidatus Neomarinimicrobiota bacterium]